MLEFVDLYRRFGDVVALDGLSFRVPAASMFGFLGPNGAGKTTAMRALFGLVELERGSVYWEHRPITAELRRSFGYLPEERGLYPAMRVLEQLAFLGRLHGWAARRSEEVALQWLDRFGLAAQANAKVESLSMGNQQRVQLIAAVLHEPALLVLDEPFIGLDPVAVDDLGAVLRELTENGTTVLFSSHQLDLVEHLCERVAIVQAGRVVTTGSVEELTSAGRRRLVLRIGGKPHDGWAEKLPGVTVSEARGGRVRLLLEARADAQDVLQAAAAVGPVEHFSFERRRLSEVFREAVSVPPKAPEGTGPAPDGRGRRQQRYRSSGSRAGARS